MFLHKGEYIPIPEHIKLSLQVTDDQFIHCDNDHLMFIISHSYEELLKGELYEYAKDFTLSDISELSYLFELLKFDKKYNVLLAKISLYIVEF